MATFGWVEPEDFFVTHLADRDRAFWLDGAGSRPWSGQLSYVGWLEPADLSLTLHAASRSVTAHQHGQQRRVGVDIFAELRRHAAADRAAGDPGGWVGFFGYASRSNLAAQVDPDPAAVDACWLRAMRIVEFDHDRQVVRAVAAPGMLRSWAAQVGEMVESTEPAGPPVSADRAEVVATCDASEFAAAFARVQAELRLGNSYETNLTFQTRVTSDTEPLDAYRRLRRSSPAPYAGFITHLGMSVLSSSPERFVTVTGGRLIETRPIKGTTPRDPDPARDAAAARRLRQEPKFRGENLMIVDLLRNDLSRVCEVGTVEVTDLMHVESYPAVHQLVTTIEGRLREGVATLDALLALFPGGSMTGAPKLRTMQIIADVESSPRGVYAGAMGWLLDDGRADLGIVIRSLVHRDALYTMGTGGGITVHSRCADEFAEAGWKLSNLLRCLGLDPRAAERSD